MKKKTNFFLLFPFISIWANAQIYNGKVGINTESPTQTLDVNGDVNGSKLTTNYSTLSSTGLVVMATSDGTLKSIPKKTKSRH